MAAASRCVDAFLAVNRETRARRASLKRRRAKQVCGRARVGPWLPGGVLSLVPRASEPGRRKGMCGRGGDGMGRGRAPREEQRWLWPGALKLGERQLSRERGSVARSWRCGAKRGWRVAWAGNRTRASRVAGENSTTEPPMHPRTWSTEGFPSGAGRLRCRSPPVVSVSVSASVHPVGAGGGRSARQAPGTRRASPWGAARRGAARRGPPGRGRHGGGLGSSCALSLVQGHRHSLPVSPEAARSRTQPGQRPNPKQPEPSVAGAGRRGTLPSATPSPEPKSVWRMVFSRVQCVSRRTGWGTDLSCVEPWGRGRGWLGCVCVCVCVCVCLRSRRRLSELEARSRRMRL